MALTRSPSGLRVPRRRTSCQQGGAAHGGTLRERWDRRAGSAIRSSGVGSQVGLSALRDSSLRRLLAAQLASICGDFVVITALPFAVFSIGGSTAQVGIAFGAGAFLEVLAVLFGGVVGDRFQRRSVMVAADASRFGSQLFLAVLLIAGVAEFWQLIAVQVIQGAGAAFFNPAMSGLLPEVVPEERLQDANALRASTFAAGAMVGPALAGLLIATGGVGWAFAVDAITFLVSAVLLASIRIPGAAPLRDTTGSVIRDLLDGWREFRRRTWLWVVVTEFALLNALVFGPFQMLGASVAAESLGGAGAWALILTAIGVGQLGGGLMALGWRPQRPLFTATLLVVSWAAPLTLLAVAAPLPAIAFTACLAGATLSIFGAMWHTMLQSRVAENQRSRMSSYDLLGSLALLPLGYLIAGAAQAAVGAEMTLIGAASVVLVATVIVVRLPAIRGIRTDERSRRLTLSAEPSADSPGAWVANA